ncbi:MAG: PilZ domain-containing protein [Proteobacteria bacterium]|nr:PilZ domain-containing protein [Pseudomonadota bacterium]
MTARVQPRQEELFRSLETSDGMAPGASSQGSPRGPDHRRSYRIRPATDRQPRLVTAGGVELDLRDLSTTGSSVIWRRPDAGGADISSVVMHLPDGTSFSSALRIMRVDRQDDRTLHLGVRFESLTLQAERSLANFMIRELQGRDAELGRLLSAPTALRSTERHLISLLLRRHAAEGRPVHAFHGQKRIPWSFRVVGLDVESTPGRLALQPFGPDQADTPARAFRDEGPFTFELSGPMAVTLFSSAVQSVGHGQVIVDFPDEVLQTGFRQSPRVRPSPQDRGEVALTHDRYPENAIRGPLASVAARGLSLSLDTSGRPLVPGDHLPQLLVTLPTGPVEAAGIVRGTSGDPSTGQIICGVELLDFGGTKDSRRWHDYVFRTAFPRLAGTSETGARDAWDLLDASRYLVMWTDPEARSNLRARFVGSWSEASPEHNHRLILRSADTHRAGMMATLLYPGTWMIHQIGVVEAERRRGDRSWFSYVVELYAGLTYLLEHLGALEHLLIYFAAGKSWNDLVYGEFARRYAAPGRLTYTELSVFRAIGNASPAPPLGQRPATPHVVGTDAAPELWSLVLVYAETQLTPLERSAFGFDDASVDLADFSARCREQGHRRARSLYVAFDPHGPTAALLLETGDEGINVFGLMNTCRILPLNGGWPDAETLAALLTQARAHFDRAQVQQHLLLAPPSLSAEDRAVLGALGYAYVSEGLRWLSRKEVLPLWIAYLDDLLASLALEKELSCLPPVTTSD